MGVLGVILRQWGTVPETTEELISSLMVGQRVRRQASPKAASEGSTGNPDCPEPPDNAHGCEIHGESNVDHHLLQWFQKALAGKVSAAAAEDDKRHTHDL